MIPDTENLSDPHEFAASVTRRSASNLWFVGQALSVEKRRLFEAAYATMRVIDDYVDNEFLAGDEHTRTKGRDSAIGRIELWRNAALNSLSGTAQGKSLSPRDEALFDALQRTAGRSDIPNAPWLRLAEAMRFDVEERALETWDCFESYCEGATVAPASVFLYVLQASPHSESRLVAGIGASDLADQARDMGVFCYLVHILRDFAKDAARGGQLVTIPHACFRAHGLSRSAVIRTPELAVPVLQEISLRADHHRREARRVADRLIPRLATVEGRILDSLLSIYERIHDAIRQDPTPGNDHSGLTASLRATLASRLGLPAV